ncbi:hypothetical protein A5662_11250 [Mycobacteriaceae bacterium 1482268.1]|nr:hypothetical protein A5662_11250 [Mycobacteriaceae bacterium 1482268.1]
MLVSDRLGVQFVPQFCGTIVERKRVVHRGLWTRLRRADENGAVAALLNGPRYWLMSSIGKVGRNELVRKTFGGLEMIRQATVALSSMNPAPYQANKVDRKAVFTFAAGREIYQLVDPDRGRWIMQTYSQTVDKNLTLADLRGLASRLSLPQGWRFETSTPSSPVVIDTTGQDAIVTQDDLANSYSLHLES